MSRYVTVIISWRVKFKDIKWHTMGTNSFILDNNIGAVNIVKSRDHTLHYAIEERLS